LKNHATAEKKILINNYTHAIVAVEFFITEKEKDQSK